MPVRKKVEFYFRIGYYEFAWNFCIGGEKGKIIPVEQKREIKTAVHPTKSCHYYIQQGKASALFLC